MTPLTGEEENVNLEEQVVQPDDRALEERVENIEVPEIRRSSRTSELPRKYHDYICNVPGREKETSMYVKGGMQPRSLADTQTYTAEYRVSMNNVMKIHDLRSFKEANADTRWQEAMQQELQALESNETWELTQLPAGKRAIDCKWVYKTKYKQDGTVERLKARLVARGDRQIEGKDYKQTFSPVAKFATVE